MRGWNWQRSADVLLVGALVVTLGVTAEAVLDRDSAPPDVPAVEGPRSGERPGVASGLTAADPGSLATHRVTASGTLVVKQRLVTGAATSGLTLSNGSASSTGQGDDGALVRDLTITVDGEEAEPSQTTLQEGESTEVVLEDSADDFRLGYVVEDAVAASSPFTPGRAVVELATVRTDDTTGPRILRVRAGETGEVLSMACGPRLAMAEPCGQAGPEGWSVQLAGADRDTRVFASVDLPTG